MKRSAGAPASICLASALLPAYATTTLSPPRASNCRACSSSASLRLAAAKTVTLAPAAGMIDSAKRASPSVIRHRVIQELPRVV